MTKKEKVEAIYLAKPELVNDDVGLVLCLLKICRYPDVTLEQAMRKLGNPEHWTRAARIVRAEEKKKRDKARFSVREEVEEAREEEFVNYRYNDEANHAISWLND